MTQPENPAQKIWQDQPVEGIKMSTEILHKRAAKLERRILWRNVREYVASLIAVGLLAYFFASAHSRLDRVTFALFIAALGWIVVQLHRRGSTKIMPAGVDTGTALGFYRAELERQRDAVKTVWSWYLAPMVPGIVLAIVAYAMKHHGSLRRAMLALITAFIAVLFFVIWKMNMRAARSLQHMIDELNAASGVSSGGRNT